MIKNILLLPLIAGAVTPLATTDLSPNMLAGYSPLYLNYNTTFVEYFLSNRLYAGDGVDDEVVSLMKVDYWEPDAGIIIIDFDYYPAFPDYILDYGVNVYINDLRWNIQPIIYYNNEINGYELVYSFLDPYDFNGDYNVYVEPHTEEGRTGFYMQIESYDYNITDIKVSIDILEEGLRTLYNRGYVTGYDEGYDTGYDEGYQDGEDDALVNTSFVDFIVNAVGGFMDFEIFPNFSIGNVLGAFVAVIVAVILLRVFAGG